MNSENIMDWKGHSKEDASAAATTTLNAQSLSVRAQKKILGTMGHNKNVAKLFIDDRSAHLLDTLSHLTRDYLNGNKRRAEKLLKYSIKSTIKFLVLLRNDQLTTEQLSRCGEFRRKLRHVAVTLISFHEVEYSFDRTYLSGLVRECGQLLTGILRDHLTAKSIGRIEDVFQFYASEDFLQWLFADGRGQTGLKSVVEDLHGMLGANAL